MKNKLESTFSMLFTFCAASIAQGLALSNLQAAPRDKRVDQTVKAPATEIPDPSKYDSPYAKYIPGVGYLQTARTNVGLQIFSDRLISNRRLSNLTSSDLNDQSTARAALDILRDESARARREIRQAHGRRSDPASRAATEVMFTSVPTPSAVTTTLIGVELMLDDLLNRANSAVSSALFAMRSHVAATVSDLNVVFRNNMNETFDRLSAEQQKIITQAQVLAAQAQETIKQVEQSGYEHAADLICQTTANFANYNIGLPIKQFLKPDLLCMKELNIRDVGPQHEQLLTFRGVRLMPEEEYPAARITVAGQVLTSTTGGGDSVLQMPLPGGINGQPNDTSLRGDRIGQAEFIWSKAATSRRWLFTLKPYLVRSLDAVMTPTIKGPVRKDRAQTCYVHADGGSLGSREEYATCTIIADEGWEVENCLESGPTTANGDAGIRNRLFTAGACQWEMRAKSKSWYGAGAWYGFEGRAREKQITRISGHPFEDRKVVNQSDTSAIFTYPDTLVPQEYQILAGDWHWQLHYLDNTGRGHTLTDSQPSEPGIGVGSIGGNNLTFSAQQ